MKAAAHMLKPSLTRNAGNRRFFSSQQQQQQQGAFRFLILLPSVVAYYYCAARHEEGHSAGAQEGDGSEDDLLGQRSPRRIISAISEKTPPPMSERPLVRSPDYWKKALSPFFPTTKTLCERRRSNAALTDHEHTLIDTFQRVSGSVAYIFTTAVVSTRRGLQFRATEIPAGTGSGFLWDDKGHVVTNYHVVAAATGVGGAGMLGHRDNIVKPRPVKVKLSGLAQAREAVVVGVEPEKDLAVLKLKDVQNLPRPIEIGTSNDLRVGQTVLAIGNVSFAYRNWNRCPWHEQVYQIFFLTRDMNRDHAHRLAFPRC